MSFHRLISVIRRLLGRERALARCPVPKGAKASIILMTAVLMAGRVATATVAVTGDVVPTDNPLPRANGTNPNEGLPSNGNSISPFVPAGSQTLYEGIVDPTNSASNLNIDEIIVGRSSFGAMAITGESTLRDQTLTIGGSGPRDPSQGGGVNMPGTGVVRITGFRSTYNNDPTIPAPGVPVGVVLSVKPRPLTGADGNGNDLWVGRAGTVTTPASGTNIVGGTGTLEISAGGRAEIQDAVVVGADPNSTGSIIVDGFDSFLGSGGFAAGGGGGGGGGIVDPHQMIIGRQGVGYLTISNGGTVRSDAPTGGGGSGGSVGPVGAVIGSDVFELGNVPPDPGGVGTVTVNGTASKWVVSGSLQVGGFSFGQSGVVAGDPEGDNVQYSSAAGRGTLNVQAGAVVNVVNALDADANLPKVLVAIGRFGRVQLDGGLINIGSVTGGGNDTEARNNSVQLINDGVISGSGRIVTGVFNNRYLGEVRVTGGQKLLIDSAADILPATGSPVLTNFGVMQVFGTGDLTAELEFDRAPTAPLSPIQPFQNLRIERPTGAPIGDFFGGLISAQSAILRFRSGIQNSGMMAFTAGQNYVTGNVVNMPGPALMPADTGIINISGPGTKVTFENDLINLGVLNISGGATVDVLARHSFVTTGNLKMTINPENTNQIFSAGDAGIAGKLSINLAGFGPGDLHIGDTFQILSVGGSLGGVNLSDPLYPKVDLAAAPMFSLVSFPNLAGFGLAPTTALVPMFTSNSILVKVVSLASAMGPDFNGDGLVNGLDLNVWLANVGLTSGASVTQGDADSDGDVDGDDFLFWQRNIGRPMPWTGSGSGAAAAVPEPTGLALLAISALLSLTKRRSR